MHVEMEPTWLPRLSAMMMQGEAAVGAAAAGFRGTPRDAHPGHVLWICCASDAIPRLPPAGGY